ncbi:hypothetical protein [Aequorivita capsosiphonis]|uniref:hypothetical protein n=1 Tax=Aequorivita capsosiphonis TaxID=487317 RepID=UPI000422516B|nr:hypothetical protein [Aequorivita capsosiphonis]
MAQQTQKVNPQFANGNFIDDVRIIILEGNAEIGVSQAEMEDFYKAFFIKPGTTFNPLITDLAISRIKREENVENAYYELYESASGTGTVGRSVWLQIYVTLTDEKVKTPTRKGIFVSEHYDDFPLLYESGQAQFKLMMKGGLGFYNDVNPLFAQGEAFTQGNPIADDPPGKETRFWLETFVEPGISGISKLGNSNVYWYGEVSALVSARNTTDIYSSGSTAHIAFERLYGGFLVTGLGKNKDITINANYGRNFFQLNDGFLFSRYSGSSNAGPRGSVYSSSRTTYQKNGNLSIQWKKFRLSGHFVEPQELFRDKQINTNYAIGTFNYNNNNNLDTGISYIQTTGGQAKYATPDGAIQKKGMYVINPKLWISNIAETRLFFKSEYAYQSHTSEDMKSYAWYAGLGYSFKDVSTSPSVYYRYAFMKGDNANTETYERFDSMLTGGLGNWVQGLNFRKVLGNGNIVSHRIELTSWVSRKMSLSVDYFYLQANQLNNLGGLPPLSTLKNKELGHEASVTLKGLLKDHFTFLGVVSYGIPGKGLEEVFIENTPNWLTVQAAVFINY